MNYSKYLKRSDKQVAMTTTATSHVARRKAVCAASPLTSGAMLVSASPSQVNFVPKPTCPFTTLMPYRRSFFGLFVSVTKGAILAQGKV